MTGNEIYFGPHWLRKQTLELNLRCKVVKNEFFL